MSPSPASIIIPTRGRPGYLEVALGSLTAQAAAAGVEVLVVDDGADGPDGPDGPDGADGAVAAVAARHGARVLATPRPDATGANAARNAGIAGAAGDLIVLLDDDVRVPDGWLAALLDGARAAPDHDVFGGPIRAVLEGGGPRSCGREGPPITALDLGPRDRDADLVWSANMAIRRRAVERVGPFDESIHGRGEEEDWERRYAAAGGRIRYLAATGLEHRRTRADARLAPLARAGHALGRTARRYDVLKGTAPPCAGELRVLLGCAGHVVRYRCPNMIVGVAHAAGRLREALAERGR